MRELYEIYLDAEKDIKSILGAQLMAETPQDYSTMEGMIRGIIDEWSDKGTNGIAFFVHVLASKCEQFYVTVAQAEGREPMELFRDVEHNGFTPENPDMPDWGSSG